MSCKYTKCKTVQVQLFFFFFSSAAQSFFDSRKHQSSRTTQFRCPDAPMGIGHLFISSAVNCHYFVMGNPNRGEQSGPRVGAIVRALFTRLLADSARLGAAIFQGLTGEHRKININGEKW